MRHGGSASDGNGGGSNGGGSGGGDSGGGGNGRGSDSSRSLFELDTSANGTVAAAGPATASADDAKGGASEAAGSGATGREADHGAAFLAARLRPCIVLALALLARFGAAGSASLCYVAAAEQFPTDCRNSAIGFGAACGRFASVLAPIAVHLLPSPSLILAAIALCAATAALALPETAGKPITEHDDGEARSTKAAMRDCRASEASFSRVADARHGKLLG